MNFSKIDYSRPFTSGILIAESEDGEYAIVSEVTESEAEETARADYHRRQALLEIDVLVAQALGMTLDELLTEDRTGFGMDEFFAIVDVLREYCDQIQNPNLAGFVLVTSAQTFCPLITTVLRA